MPRIKVIREDILSQQEVEDMISIANNIRDKAIISILYLYGCRITECLNLKKSDITIDNKYIHIKFTVLKRKSKSGLPFKHVVLVNRDSPFTSYIIDHVTAFDNPDDDLFLNDNGNRMMRQEFTRILKKITNNAWCHLFRHTRLTKLAEQGATATQLMTWAGWTDTRPAGIYVQRSTKLIKPLADKIE